MKCPACNDSSCVIDTRLNKDNTIRRRRKCLNCGYRWSTYEEIVESYEKEKNILSKMFLQLKKELCERIKEWTI